MLFSMMPDAAAAASRRYHTLHCHAMLRRYFSLLRHAADAIRHYAATLADTCRAAVTLAIYAERHIDMPPCLINECRQMSSLLRHRYAMLHCCRCLRLIWQLHGSEWSATAGSFEQPVIIHVTYKRGEESASVTTQWRWHAYVTTEERYCLLIREREESDEQRHGHCWYHNNVVNSNKERAPAALMALCY